MKKIIIALDGYSACGKSTTAKEVAKVLAYVHVDSGAMYRAVALYCLNNLLSWHEISPDLLTALDKMKIHFVFNSKYGSSDTYLNDENVENEIRTMAVSRIVSEVAAIKEVRVALVEMQRKLGVAKGIVMEGRDIGTVVFPQAELKMFMTASLEKRIERRSAELKQRGNPLPDAEIKENIEHRDRIDTTRKESPLKQAEDSVVLDTTGLTIAEQVNIVVEKARELIGKESV